MYIVDRFEETWAVIEMDDRTMFRLPRSILPVDLREGDVIDIQVSINSALTKQRSQQAKKALDNFFDD